VNCHGFGDFCFCAEPGVVFNMMLMLIRLDEQTLLDFSPKSPTASVNLKNNCSNCPSLVLKGKSS
jgi:hypothetical protein